MPHARRCPCLRQGFGRQARTMKMGFHCSLACNGIGGFATLNPPYFWFRFYCLFRVFTLCAVPYALCEFLAKLLK